MGYYIFVLRSFLSPRTSIGFHKKLKTTKYWFLKKRSFLKEFSPMGSLNLQMRPTAVFSLIRSGCLLIMLVCNL